MVFFKLACKNILRHRRRSLLTVTGIAVSIALLFAILSLTRGFEKRIEKDLKGIGIDFLVVPVSCPHEVASLLFHGEVAPVFLDQEIVVEVKKTPGIEFASPMIAIQVPDPEKKRKILLYGYEALYVKEIKPYWKIKGEMPAGWEALRLNKILVGSGVAKKEGLKIGDNITYPGTNRTFLVSGILERTFSKDDAFIYTDLKVAQEVAIEVAKLPVIEIEDPTCVLKHRITDDPVSAVAVKLKDRGSLMQVKEDLKKRIPNIKMVSVSEVIKSIAVIAASAKVLALSIVAVALLISAAGVVNSMLTAVFERSQEIGMMRAIGASRADIFRIFIIETIIITSAGGVIGIALAFSGTPIIEVTIGRLMPFLYSKELITFDPIIATFCIILSLILGVCAGLYPAWRASRVSPIEAIRGL